MAVASTEAAERRRHYLVENGPRDWLSDVEVARWVLALCLKRDGREDALTRADEILPRRFSRHGRGAEHVLAGLSERECGAVAVALYLTFSGALSWSRLRIVCAFGVGPGWASEVIEQAAVDCVIASREFREGVNDVSLAIADAMAAHVGGKVVVTDETPAEMKSWGPDAA